MDRLEPQEFLQLQRRHQVPANEVHKSRQEQSLKIAAGTITQTFREREHADIIPYADSVPAVWMSEVRQE